MMQASSVTCPSRSGRPPNPTLRLPMSFSEFITPFSTASSALPRADKTFHASAFASTPCFQVEITNGLFSPSVIGISFAYDLFTEANAALMADHLRKLLLVVIVRGLADD